MNGPPRSLAILNGSPREGSSVSLLLEAAARGAREAGATVESFRCIDLAVKHCVACGPDATPGYCIFHDDMDRVYAALERAHAVIVGSPSYFDTVSAPLKAVIDRCNCVTPLVTLPDGRRDTVPKWRRTRRAAFVAACSANHSHELAERTVRGFLKWVGARWEESVVWSHDDDDLGTVTPELLARAHALGRRLVESPPHED